MNRTTFPRRTGVLHKLCADLFTRNVHNSEMACHLARWYQLVYDGENSLMGYVEVVRNRGRQLNSLDKLGFKQSQLGDCVKPFLRVWRKILSNNFCNKDQDFTTFSREIIA